MNREQSERKKIRCAPHLDPLVQLSYVNKQKDRKTDGKRKAKDVFKVHTVTYSHTIFHKRSQDLDFRLHTYRRPYGQRDGRTVRQTDILTDGG